MAGGERFCPVCERRFAAEACPDDGIPTVDAASVADDPKPVGPGTTIAGRYRVDGVLGEGGMGTVYRATREESGGPVALKVLLRHLIAEPRILRRFYQEAQAASVLDHPNIVRLFEFGYDGACRVPFLAMELLEGRTLRALLLDGGPMGERRAAGILAQVAGALVEAHDKRVVHRDLKTENVMVRVLPEGVEHVKVLDFGIAKILGAEGEAEVALTMAGEALGTPATMSPEQIRGEPVDFRADLYALGCILHTVLCGRPPFTAEERMTVLYKHLHEAAPPLPPALADGHAPGPDLVALHAALLAKSRHTRPASTAVVARILGALARGEAPGATALLDGAQRAAGGPRRATGGHAAARGPERTPVRSRTVDGNADLRTPTQRGRTALASPHGDRPAADADLLPRRHTGRVVAVATLVIASILAVAGLAWRAPRDPDEDRAAQAATAPAIATPSPVRVAPPPARSVIVRSEPAGATVLRDGSDAGRTPVAVTAPDAGVELRLRLPGYADALVRVDARSPAEQTVRLVPQVEPSSKAPRATRPVHAPAAPPQAPAGGVEVW